MAKLRALFDVVVYRDEAGNTLSFVKGEIVDVPSEQVDRLLDIGAAEKVTGSKAAEKPPAAEKPVNEMSAKELKEFAKGKGIATGRARSQKDLLAAVKKGLEGQAAAADTPPDGTPPAGDVDPDEPTTPAGDPAGDGKTDQDA